MPRQRKTPRKERRKVVRVQFLPRPERRKKDDAENPYSYLDDLIHKHHADLWDAKLAVAWMLDVKPDRDGHLVLGKLKKATDLDREFRDFDLVLLLNAAAWNALPPEKRTIAVDHFLCAGALMRDRTGEPIIDERGRKCYRLRRYDVESYDVHYARYGVFVRDLAGEIVDAAVNPLFASNGEAAHAEK